MSGWVNGGERVLGEFRCGGRLGFFRFAPVRFGGAFGVKAHLEGAFCFAVDRYLRGFADFANLSKRLD